MPRENRGAEADEDVATGAEGAPEEEDGRGREGRGPFRFVELTDALRSEMEELEGWGEGLLSMSMYRTSARRARLSSALVGAEAMFDPSRFLLDVL